MDNAAMGELVMAGFKKLGFLQYAGIDGVEYLPGRNVVAMDPKPEHLNHNGDLHAAILFGLAETAAMGASISGIVDLMGETFIVARDGKIEYLARAKGEAGPIRATAELSAQTIERTRADIAARTPIELAVPVDITDGTGKSVAAASFTAVIRPRR
ncbi:PaaI family thioesterase [Nocardia mexicana]|uniref:Acyl-coenzyme A thioesterase PaaI-like protein n=1 Tax=Nocardia mexicana TaxID=279262 RepID=A0A370H679_9NOCA|nr:PaaI family thioesterase [Nocardia mexicana]RDI51920.1 acyl-coenzyme A thioesterase PaaI-like protein [Nocardia mexicana]